MDQIDDFIRPVLNEPIALVPSHIIIEFIISLGYINFYVACHTYPL